ncbi:ABC transporter ATP-binding protein YtrB [Clostridium acetireducens DSM 10703]|jgi:ABC-2 type transport system ATP-binding protein|uniref:ABC transporter ATP-binding protein YtrB n=1 Tax=Clostridium acetireducens DSM 10703 TaxID=1121290 RepID=A0A1E8F0K0_9CLOT|nr:ABC transporter ATP-binding protein [Clostridium acetireducens]OFI06971.1 ABC transporter ATP-binding protein YtrB [Clostridium acetireducens DSM 10703]
MEKLLLKASNINKNYFKKKALDNFSLELEKGKILGVLGPNGSGKTTFLKILAGILKANSGEVLISSEKVGFKTKSYVAYLPDRNFLYKWMKVKDAIDFYNDFFKDFNKEKCKEILKDMDLDEEMKVKNLSKGMTEKLLLTLTLSREAKIYLLDEPLGGVDPVTREKILSTIIENFNEESSMIITTHLVSDIERLFDEVVFISQGKLILKGNTEDLRNEKSMSIDELYREVFK